MSSPTPALVDVKNIQGDVILGLPKRLEFFIFFRITNASLFRKQLRLLVPLITTTEAVQADRARIEKNKEDAKARGVAPPVLEMVGTNIAFSKFGLQKFDFLPGNLGDLSFASGQLEDAPSLSDPIDNATGKPKWDDLFLNPIDGVVLVTAESQLSLTIRKLTVEALLLGSITVLRTLQGTVRPGLEKGHEHFGYNDGLSQPAILGFQKPLKGQQEVDRDVILLGDERKDPALAKDGSFLVFRKLNQRVPEFDKWLDENQNIFQGGRDLLGARLVGRWKSGTPIDLAPTVDIPSIADDPDKVNDFQYTFLNPDDQIDQTRCPFSAHLRKTNPRGDIGNDALAGRRIIRHGITFGPEVTDDEKANKATKLERGLYFVSYQASIDRGFAFIQSRWANNPTFPPGKPLPANVSIGLDPIIGQNGTDERKATGISPTQQALEFPFPTFVETRGGEYFFSPSIKVLRDVIGDSIF